jgi:translation initiation factor IF-2
LRKAEPASPVEILGIDSVPSVGDTLTVTATERDARSMAQERQEEKKKALTTAKPLSLSNISSEIREGGVKELNVILKTDVQGSIEPIKTSLEQKNTEEVQVHILHADSGSITESDVLLALASRGIILGFNTPVEPGATQLAESEGIDIRSYEVIYNLVDDVEKAMKGMLEPTYIDVVEGHAEVRAVFPARGGKVAGVYINEGKVTRGSLARIIRQGEAIFDSRVSSLKRFKEDTKEVASGFECGVGVEGYSDFEIGDVIEFYNKEEA